MRNTRENSGITLIALVITIIVLLILAGVALATLTGNTSIIDNANKAVESYNKEAEEDQKVLNQVKDLFEKYMGEGGGNTTPAQTYNITYNANGGTGTMEAEEASTTATSTFTAPTGKVFKEWNTAQDGSGTSYAAGATVTSDVDLYAIWYDPLSAHVHVGDYITYDPELGVAIADKARLLNYTSPVGELKIKNGNDYIIYEYENFFNYVEWNNDDYYYNDGRFYALLNENGNFVLPAGYTFESDIHGNGYEEQSFTAMSSNNLWRVLDITNGVIKIVPETPIKTSDSKDFYMQGLRGYKNAVIELNNISEIFGHGQGANSAESITVEQINKLTGYRPEDASLENVKGYVNKAYLNTNYFYKKSDFSGANSNITNMLYKNSYWIASYAVNANSDENNFYADFGVKAVFEPDSYGGLAMSSPLWSANSSTHSPGSTSFSSHGVFPVVTLKSDVEFLGDSETDGSQQHPWIFQATE